MKTGLETMKQNSRRSIWRSGDARRRRFPAAMSFLISGIVLFFMAIAPSGFAGNNEEDSGREYIVGVVPQFDSRKISSIWSPILMELEKGTHRRFRLKGSPTIPEFEKEFIFGTFDFAYMNPYHILPANQQRGYIPLVRDVGRFLYGILVAPKSRGVESVKELNGQAVAFPAPNALGASLMIRAAFEDEFNIKVRSRYVQTHTSVYLNVALGRVKAGGGVQKTLEQQKSDIKNALKIIYKTSEVAPHPFSAHPRVPESVRNEVMNALLAMGKEEEGEKNAGKSSGENDRTGRNEGLHPFEGIGPGKVLP